MDLTYADTARSFRHLESVQVATSDGRRTTMTDIAGDWSMEIDNARTHQGFWCMHPGHDSGYIELERRDVKYPDQDRIAILGPTIADSLTDVRVVVDSMRNDTLWYRVQSTVPPSYPYITIFFYDKAETDPYRVKKWSATLETFAVVSARSCDGRPLVSTSLSFVQPMYDANSLYACAAIGEPLTYYTYTVDAEGSNVVSVGGVGRLSALRAMRH